jgi:hypothetical protein
MYIVSRETILYEDDIKLQWISVRYMQKGGGGVVSAIFLHFWNSIFANDTKPASATKATTVHSQQLSQVWHRYIDLTKTNMNNR